MAATGINGLTHSCTEWPKPPDNFGGIFQVKAYIKKEFKGEILIKTIPKNLLQILIQNNSLVTSFCQKYHGIRQKFQQELMRVNGLTLVLLVANLVLRK